MTRLADIALARHAAVGEADAAAIDAALASAIDAAEAGAPGVELDREKFAAHLGRWLRPDQPPREAIAALHLDQLWLACAAAEGSAAAVALIEQRHVGRAVAALRGMGNVADEALQRMREILFVARADRPPRIADYGGRGDLAAWIRTTAMREAFQLLAPAKEAPVDEQALGGYALPGTDPAVELMKQQYGASFKQALADAMAQLPQQTRIELRRYYIEGLGLEQIAALEGVAPSTISRRLDKARRALHEATRRALAVSLHVGDEEVDSILRLLDSRLDMSRSLLEDER